MASEEEFVNMGPLNILHLSYDYKESQKSKCTPAVRNLIEILQTRSINKIISLHRIAHKFTGDKKLISHDTFRLESFAPPFSIFLKFFLRRTYGQIADICEKGLINLDETQFIHTHKSMREGYIGYLLSKKYNIPLLTSIRMSDFFLLHYRPDLIPLYREILNHSQVIFYIMPYMKSQLNKLISSSAYKNIDNKLVFLPNYINLGINPDNGIKYEKGRLLTVLSMENKKIIRRKNIYNIIRAFSQLNHRHLHLDIIGEGRCIDQVKYWVKKFKVTERVSFLYYIPNNEIYRYYRRAEAFILPSHSETFGLVYAESLINNTPILYSKGTGFDGMFENVGVAVDSKQPGSIMNGITQILNDNLFYRQTIQDLRSSGAFNIFKSDFILNSYLNALGKQFINC